MSFMADHKRALTPGSTIGILGGGQLGRMMAVAAAQLGYLVHIYTPENDSPASHVAANTTVAEYTDAAALSRFAQAVDVITYEFENVALEGVAVLAQHKNVYPSGDVLSVCQHRVKEKEFIRAQGIETAPFAAVSSLADLEKAAAKLGLPAVLKTCRMGYDGKGQAMIRDLSELKTAWEQVGGGRCQVSEKNTSLPPATCHLPPFILEGFVDFTMEASVIVARNAAGDIATYPLAENIHRHHILHQTIVPARVDAKVEAGAKRIAHTLAEALQLVGILAVELFITKDGRVLVNEMAPRPHNSGHWSLDACITSQFEQSIRAVCNLPLGSVERLADAVMTNLIGDEINDWPKYLQNPQAKLHLYGKTEARPGRKMGHVTVLGKTL